MTFFSICILFVNNLKVLSAAVYHWRAAYRMCREFTEPVRMGMGVFWVLFHAIYNT